jgi:hypothetical protein
MCEPLLLQENVLHIWKVTGSSLEHVPVNKFYRLPSVCTGREGSN